MSDENEVTNTGQAPSPSEGVSPGHAAITRRNFLGAAALAAGVVATTGAAAPHSYLSKLKSLNFRAQLAPVTLTLMSWEPYGEPYEYPEWIDVISQFEIANPNITVVWTGWPFSEFDQNIVEQAQAGSVDADVIMVTPEAASTLVQKYHIGVPIGDIAKELDLVPDSAHQSYVRNGDLYALGVIDVAFALLYNEAVLAAHHLKPPTTLDEWLAATEAVTKAPKYFGNSLLSLVSDGSAWWNQLQNFCLPYGGVWAKGTELTIDSPANIKGAQFYIDLLNASGVKGESNTVLTKVFDENRICFSFNVAAGLSSLKTLAPAYYPNMRSTAPPWASKQAIERLHPLIVNNKSKYVEESRALVKYILTPKTLYNITVANGYPIIPYSNFGELIPAYAKYLDTIWLKGFEETDYVGEFQILGQFTYAYAELGTIICQNLEKAVSGSSTVTQALQAAQAQAKVQLNL